MKGNGASTSIEHIFIKKLDDAVEAEDTATICENVKRVLVDVMNSKEQILSEEYLIPNPECYARRLLHKDPEGRYSAVVMVWDKSQGTPLHDHAGRWCVEGVYRGKIRVRSYNYDGKGKEGIHRFTQETEVTTGVGEAGALIPPFEYHSIENPDERPAITIHVYRGELFSCNAFYPLEEGGYRRVSKTMTYTE